MVRKARTSESCGHPIRVLHALSSLAVRNGMLSVVESYHKHLDPDEVTFDYMYFYDLPDNRKEEIEASGSRTFFLPFKDLKRPLRAIESFFAEYEGEWDVLHCHPPFTPQLYARAAKRHGIKRVVAHSHSTKFSDKPLSAARNWTLSRLIGFFATDYVVCSDAARVLLGRHGKNGFLLRNAIECDRFAFDSTARASARAELEVPDGTLILGSVGRLAEEKSQQCMLIILRAMKERGVSCKLAIAGSGPKEQFLRERAVELGVANDFLLLGNRSDTPRLYSAFDVFLLTSLFEGLPISLIEAQTSGLPCLVSDAVTTEANIVNTRYLSIKATPSVWVDAALAGWEGGTDRAAACEAVGAAGYDVSVETSRLAGFYRSILGGIE